MDGQFDGIVSVALLPGYFESFYSRMAVNDGSYFALARADGNFLARFPEPKDRSVKLDARSQFQVDVAHGLDRNIYTCLLYTSRCV